MVIFVYTCSSVHCVAPTLQTEGVAVSLKRPFVDVSSWKGEFF